MSDQADERAGADDAWQRYLDERVPRRSGQATAFGAAWQARGEYDRARVAGLVAVVQNAVDNELHEGGCPTAWGTRERCTCWLRDARAALANTPTATDGASAGGER